MTINRQDVYAAIEAARIVFPREFLSELEARFYQTPVAITALLWAMADMAGQSRSEPGRQWKEIAAHLMEANKAARNLEG